MPRAALHASALGFRHPKTGEWRRFSIDMPTDFKLVCGALRKVEWSKHDVYKNMVRSSEYVERAVIGH